MTRTDRRAAAFLFATAALAGLDTGSFGPLLPSLRGALGLDDPHAAWLITAYVLGMLVGNPLFAWCAARVGEGRALGLAAATYAGGAGLVAASPSWAPTFAGRVLQGAGAGSLMTLSCAALVLLTPPARRGRALALAHLGYGVAYLLASVAAALASQCWRGVFAALAAAGLACAAASFAGVRLSPRGDAPPFDARGFALWTASVAALAVTVQQTRAGGASGGRPLALSLACGAALLTVLLRVERGREAPFVPVHLFRHPMVRAACVLAAAAGAGQVFAAMIPSFSAVVVGVALPRVGLWALPFVGAGLAATALLAAAIDRLGARRAVAVSGALLVAGALALGLPTPSRALFVVASTVLGAGLCTLSGGPLRQLVADLAPAEITQAQSLLATVTDVGLLAGSALFGALSSDRGAVALRAAGMRAATTGTALTVLIGLAVGLLLLPRVGGVEASREPARSSGLPVPARG